MSRWMTKRGCVTGGKRQHGVVYGDEKVLCGMGHVEEGGVVWMSMCPVLWFGGRGGKRGRKGVQ